MVKRYFAAVIRNSNCASSLILNFYNTRLNQSGKSNDHHILVKELSRRHCRQRIKQLSYSIYNQQHKLHSLINEHDFLES